MLLRFFNFTQNPYIVACAGAFLLLLVVVFNYTNILVDIDEIVSKSNNLEKKKLYNFFRLLLFDSFGFWLVLSSQVSFIFFVISITFKYFPRLFFALVSVAMCCLWHLFEFKEFIDILYIIFLIFYAYGLAIKSLKITNFIGFIDNMQIVIFFFFLLSVFLIIIFVILQELVCIYFKIYYPHLLDNRLFIFFKRCFSYSTFKRFFFNYKSLIPFIYEFYFLEYYYFFFFFSFNFYLSFAVYIYFFIFLFFYFFLRVYASCYLGENIFKTFIKTFIVLLALFYVGFFIYFTLFSIFPFVKKWCLYI